MRPGHAPDARSGPDVDTPLRVGGRAPELGDHRRNADGAPRRRSVSIPAIVIYRQEVRPMYAGSAVGAPLQSTISRLG